MSLRRTIELTLLAASIVASVATSSVRQQEIAWDGTWAVENVFDGQTAVPVDHQIRLTIGYRDFSSNGDEDEGPETLAEQAFEQILLTTSGGRSVKMDVEIYDDMSLIKPSLDANSDYILDLGELVYYLRVSRQLPPPIHFSTRPGPKVTGLWRNEDTLMLSFSEPMDPDSLSLSQVSVDVLWNDKELHSIAADLNLADFVWETRGNLFMVAPVSSFGMVWVKVAGEVQGLSGGLLDGNGNGLPGEPADAFLSEVLFMPDLPACSARDDVPAPCINETDIQTWDTGWQ